MKCFYHPEQHAVAQCEKCSKGLCNYCATKYNRPICESCAKKELRVKLSYYKMPITVSVILFAVVFVICLMQDIQMQETISYCLGVISLYIGWRVFGNIGRSSSIVSGDGFAMLAFFFIKILAVLLVGVFVSPFYLVYCIYKIIKISILLKKI
jgi:hypothetical protein